MMARTYRAGRLMATYGLANSIIGAICFVLMPGEPLSLAYLILGQAQVSIGITIQALGEKP